MIFDPPAERMEVIPLDYPIYYPAPVYGNLGDGEKILTGPQKGGTINTMEVATMIYRDAIGRPNAEANISMFGGLTCPAYYSLSHVNDCPDRKWSGDTDPADIIAEMEADGWRCTLRKDGYNRPVINCIHTETQAAIDVARAQSDAKFAGSERGYIRFGSLPEGGKSRNHRDNTLEAGVSCFEAEIAASGAFRLLLTPVLEASYLTVADRPAYRLYGERVGTGADGEPLLRVDKAVKL